MFSGFYLCAKWLGCWAGCCDFVFTVGVDKPSFVSIFLLSRGARVDEHVVHPRELSQALGAYDKLVPALAQEMLGLWRADAAKLRQYAKGV